MSEPKRRKQYAEGFRTKTVRLAHEADKPTAPAAVNFANVIGHR